MHMYGAMCALFRSLRIPICAFANTITMQVCIHAHMPTALVNHHLIYSGAA